MSGRARAARAVPCPHTIKHGAYMEKRYESRSSISVSVMPDGKHSMHVAFVPNSDGSSVYVTGDEAVQRALERHYRFGKLFRLAEAYDADARAASADVPQAAPQPSGPRKVAVSDYGAAKDYLAETFGLSRTSLRSCKSITEAAAARGIEFTGI